mmetsp:Transcript_47924/g.70948  ORF Transcript_47924/g.70948 Transcript_47924/m.70948 type:complete len:793 (+) Transcript_47924:1071-3449(+)|eukprot:CAMPEP_0195508886 /NCGR_PEP_ID=MMETSP0794_2-20130614/1978_1 /TAXON_ID=515487 /ORGANISM="Stephanopyxis turris, Strain CCMP 815" /LENGTH=792 /DNA_ID=CAMNT_0040635973 /DNA_START=1065 /DNA_END=3443 /DNA_ORIENTATION=-
MPKLISEKWACGFCGAEAFRFYKDAVCHESGCQKRQNRTSCDEKLEDHHRQQGPSTVSTSNNAFTSIKELNLRMLPKSVSTSPSTADAKCSEVLSKKKKTTPHGLPPVVKLPAETSAKETSLKRKNLLEYAKTHEIVQLSEHDRALCQTVILVDGVDEQPHDIRSPISPESKIGFHCAYCIDSPLVSLPGSLEKMFPACIKSFGATLKLMSERHFLSEKKCMLMPANIRKTLQRNRHEEAWKREDISLQELCEKIAKRIGLVNRHPYHTGVIYDQPFISGRNTATDHEHNSELSLSVQSGMNKTDPYRSPLAGQAKIASFQHSLISGRGGSSCRVSMQNAIMRQQPHHKYSNILLHPNLEIGYGIQQRREYSFDHSEENLSSKRMNLELSHIFRLGGKKIPGADTIIFPEDNAMVTDFIFLLIQQLKRCHFTENDRNSRGRKREHIEVGYPGLKCRHCEETSGNRKFFWSDVDKFANSFSEIMGHVMKCRKCPEDVKATLNQLKLYHPQQIAKLPRGSQKAFFRRMWRRLHKTEDTCQAGNKEENTSQPIEGLGEDSGKLPVNQGTAENAICNHPIKTRNRVLLAIAEDKEWLSDLDCLIRRSLEVFCASDNDVGNHLLRRDVKVGQVGIRCVHCAFSNEGTMPNEVSYPSSISTIYETVQELQHHLYRCSNLPKEEKKKLSSLKTSSLGCLLKRYYVIAAKSLGMYDTSEGIRLDRPIDLAPNFPLELAQDILLPCSTEEGKGNTSLKRDMIFQVKTTPGGNEGKDKHIQIPDQEITYTGLTQKNAGSDSK